MNISKDLSQQNLSELQTSNNNIETSIKSQDNSISNKFEKNENAEKLKLKAGHQMKQPSFSNIPSAHDPESMQDYIKILQNSIESKNAILKSTQESLNHFQLEVATIRNSRSWAITAPLRALFNLIRYQKAIINRLLMSSRTVIQYTKTNGLTATFQKVVSLVSTPSDIIKLLNSGGVVKVRPIYLLQQPSPAPSQLAQRVLLIAELNLPQCLKYRVLQKKQMIESLGIECSIINWHDNISCQSLLHTHTIAIFYRVPGYKSTLDLIDTAKSLGLPTFWEVDDLIFDLEAYKANSNINALSKKTRQSVLNGVPLYLSAMLACDACIASTKSLADSMHKAGAKKVHIINNALDDEILYIVKKINASPIKFDGLIRIVYGSGSTAHDSDFREAATAILYILKNRLNVRLTIIGSLNLPTEFENVPLQIERLPSSDYETYLSRLSKCHINIAPLERSVFNDSKSNIKYLEAAALKIPSICSPTSEYKTTIEHGVTGFLASTTEEWETCLLALIDDAVLRQKIGLKAYEHATVDYKLSAIAKTLAPILEPFQKFQPKKTRILGVNILFEPRSYGGATIVAEEIARQINQHHTDIEYAMVTSLPTSEVHSYKVIRYKSSAAEVFAMGLPPESNPVLDYDNPFPTEAFLEIIKAWQPDIVHFHSIQGFGVQIAEICKEQNIPFTVTLHDAWWICARQFMVTDKGRYCHQQKIDINVCATCAPNPIINPHRQFRLHEVLSSASLLLSPSEFFRQIYINNGFSGNKIVVNKNGIVKPKRAIKRSRPSQRPLRFGFVGGEGPIKGGELIKKAFRSLPNTNYEFHIVDNELNLGRKSIFEANWSIPGVLKIVPAYTQTTIDDFFGEIDVLLFPTQWKESFGLSVREALIRDVWVIATDAGGVIEDIKDGENGNIIPLEDDGSLLQSSIAYLLNNPAQLDNYTNKYAEQICLFEDQACELVSHLTTTLKQQWEENR